jgi:rubrerythrin
MTDTEISIEEGLLNAMRAEHEGYHFYTMAAESTTDEKGKEIFRKLADDERQHAEFLKAQYESMRKTGKPDLSVSLGPKSEYSGKSPIFSDGIRERIKNAHYEMTALSIGIQLELDAVKHYNKLAEVSKDETVYKFFKDLAEWESGHYRALLDQQDVLKEDYWSASGFSPM